MKEEKYSHQLFSSFDVIRVRRRNTFCIVVAQCVTSLI